MSRKAAREKAMQLMYQMQVNDDFDKSNKDIFYEENKITGDEIKYIDNCIDTISENKDDIDNIVKNYAKGWKLERISTVDLSILRIAIYEIMFREDIPIEVSINEAVEIAKTYSSLEAGKFINGILGTFVRDKYNHESK
ncbi:transcription antitermination factor NusB [Abyssisolibacter fermentans]|uniref:transcription antitermination factor NusB n=1 Tax=Abyssisolibacter fermentans TaxID=1766203 RepID=UPI00082EFB40|nr:transcription antitermination factor NusB [Abyssisolibacter fermentans]